MRKIGWLISIWICCLLLCIISCLKQPTNKLQSMTSLQVGVPDELQGQVSSLRLESVSDKGGECNLEDTTGNEDTDISSIDLRIDCFPYTFTLTLWKDNNTSETDYWYRGSKLVSSSEASSAGADGLDIQIPLSLNPKYQDGNYSPDITAESTTRQDSSSLSSHSSYTKGINSWLLGCVYIQKVSSNNYYTCSSVVWYDSSRVSCKKSTTSKCKKFSELNLSNKSGNLFIKEESSSSWQVCDYILSDAGTRYDCYME